MDGSWDDVVARFRKNTRTTDLRKVRKYNLAYNIVTDDESIEYFYDNLYIPYLTRRFGEAFETVDHDWLTSVASDGGLLRILDGDRVIVGVVLHYDKDFLDWIWTGALTDEDVELENGAFSTLYFQSIKYAREKGFPITAVPLTPRQRESHLWGRMFIGFYFLEQLHKIMLAKYIGMQQSSNLLHALC